MNVIICDLHQLNTSSRPPGQRKLARQQSADLLFGAPQTSALRLPEAKPLTSARAEKATTRLTQTGDRGSI